MTYVLPERMELVSQRKNWDQAEQYCKDNFNGHLATIKEEEFHDVINALGAVNVWIGLNDKGTEGTFRWKAGDDCTTSEEGRCVEKAYWAINEPNNHNDDEDCVMIWASRLLPDWNGQKKRGLLNDYPCRSLLQFICQKGPNASEDGADKDDSQNDGGLSGMDGTKAQKESPEESSKLPQKDSPEEPPKEEQKDSQKDGGLSGMGGAKEQKQSPEEPPKLPQQPSPKEPQKDSPEDSSEEAPEESPELQDCAKTKIFIILIIICVVLFCR